MYAIANGSASFSVYIMINLPRSLHDARERAFFGSVSYFSRWIYWSGVGKEVRIADGLRDELIFCIT